MFGTARGSRWPFWSPWDHPAFPLPAQEIVLFGTRPPTSWPRVGPAPVRLRPPTFTYSRVSHWPARTCPSVGGGAGRPGEGAQAAAEEGDSGEGGGGGRTHGGPAY